MTTQPLFVRLCMGLLLGVCVLEFFFEFSKPLVEFWFYLAKIFDPDFFYLIGGKYDRFVHLKFANMDFHAWLHKIFWIVRGHNVDTEEFKRIKLRKKCWSYQHLKCENGVKYPIHTWYNSFYATLVFHQAKKTLILQYFYIVIQ